LYYELRQEGHFVEKEKELPLVYKDVKLECGFRVDLLVEKQVIVELKAVKKIEDIHTAQLLTYLKLANCKIGLLMNFNVFLLKDGINRLINKYYNPNI
jgi:GxxExxY protein